MPWRGRLGRRSGRLTHHTVSVQKQGAKRTRNWARKAQRLLEPSQVAPQADGYISHSNHIHFPWSPGPRDTLREGETVGNRADVTAYQEWGWGGGVLTLKSSTTESVYKQMGLI